MDAIAVVWVSVGVVIVFAGVALQLLRNGAKSPPGVKRGRYGFSGGTMLVAGNSQFGQRSGKLPRAEPGTYNKKLPGFRNPKRLTRPSVRPGDVDFWAAQNGIRSSSEALRLLVGMALSPKQKKERVS